MVKLIEVSVIKDDESGNDTKYQIVTTSADKIFKGCCKCTFRYNIKICYLFLNYLWSSRNHHTNAVPHMQKEVKLDQSWSTFIENGRNKAMHKISHRRRENKLYQDLSISMNNKVTPSKLIISSNIHRHPTCPLASLDYMGVTPSLAKLHINSNKEWTTRK